MEARLAEMVTAYLALAHSLPLGGVLAKVLASLRQEVHK